MTVELPKNLAEYVEREVASGAFPDATAVVAEAVREYRVNRIDPNVDSPELEAWLLEAIDSPMTPWRPEEMQEILAELRAKHAVK
jgi:Arc/MetJ-type ribon-helix-helix transcriptional regulator